MHVGIAEDLDVKMPVLICKKKNKKRTFKLKTSYEIFVNRLVNGDN